MFLKGSKTLRLKSSRDISNSRIAADVQNIIDSDLRVVSKDITIQQFQNGFQVEMDLYFVNEDVSEIMYVQFNQEAQIMTSL